MALAGTWDNVLQEVVCALLWINICSSCA